MRRQKSPGTKYGGHVWTTCWALEKQLQPIWKCPTSALLRWSPATLSATTIMHWWVLWPTGLPTIVPPLMLWSPGLRLESCRSLLAGEPRVRILALFSNSCISWGLIWLAAQHETLLHCSPSKYENKTRQACGPWVHTQHHYVLSAPVVARGAVAIFIVCHNQRHTFLLQRII